MKPALKQTLTAVVLGLSFIAPVAAGPYEDAKAAYERRDYATALRIFRPLADKGHALAQVHLGSMYGLGQGVPQNDAEALKWWRLAAAQGNATAQVNLGFIYSAGRGVAQNYADAMKWFRRAADQGTHSASFTSGSCTRWAKVCRRITPKR